MATAVDVWGAPLAPVEYVYPARFWPAFLWAPLSLFCLFLGLGAWEDGSDVGAAILWGVGVLAAYPAFVAVRQCIHPRPRLRFDEEGLEWSAGRILWRDVQRLELYVQERNSEGGRSYIYWAFLRVWPGTSQDRTESAGYFKRWSLRGRPVWRATGLLLPFWQLNPTKPLETLRRFSGQPVGSPRTVTRADIRDLKRRGEWPWRWSFARRK